MIRNIILGSEAIEGKEKACKWTSYPHYNGSWPFLYSSYIKENQYMNKQIKVFSPLGQQFEEDNSLEVSVSEKFGYIQPQVVDGFSEEPIEEP